MTLKNLLAAAFIAAPVALNAGVVTFNQNVGIPTGGASAVYFGTGNPNGAFTVDNDSGLLGGNANTPYDIELGLRAKVRGAADLITPTGNNYDVVGGNAGGGYSTWNFEYSIDLRPTGSQSQLDDSGIVAALTIADTLGNSLTFDPIAVAPAPGVHDDGQVGPFGTLNGTTDGNTNNPAAWASQNSENLKFFTFAGFRVNVDTVYTITLAVKNKADNVTLATDSITVNAQTPEPATMFLFPAAGLAILALRKRKAA